MDDARGDTSDKREAVDWFAGPDPIVIEVPPDSGEPWAQEEQPAAPAGLPPLRDAPPGVPEAAASSPRLRLIALAAVGAVFVASIIGLVSRGSGDDAQLPEGGSSFRPHEGGAPVRGAAVEGSARVRVTARDLPLALERAAAQLLLVGLRGKRVDAALSQRVAARDWGGIVLDAGNYADPQQLASLAGAARAAAQGAGHLTPLLAAAQAGGEDSAFRNLPPLAQPTQSTAAAARQQAALGAQQVKALGITLALAPNADLGYAGGPWEGRAFGDAPATVAAKVAAAVEGWRLGGVAAAPGHFPGEGAASQDPLDGVATVGLGLGDLRRADVRPFARVARRAPAIAMSDAVYAAWDGVTPATLLPEAVRMLRGLGFKGVVVSGNLAAATLATGRSVADAAIEALKAGCDLLYIPGDAADQEATWRAIVHAVRNGELKVARVREALGRVLALKREFGLSATAG